MTHRSVSRCSVHVHLEMTSLLIQQNREGENYIQCQRHRNRSLRRGKNSLLVTSDVLSQPIQFIVVARKKKDEIVTYAGMNRRMATIA